MLVVYPTVMVRPTGSRRHDGTEGRNKSDYLRGTRARIENIPKVRCVLKYFCLHFLFLDFIF